MSGVAYCLVMCPVKHKKVTPEMEKEAALRFWTLASCTFYLSSGLCANLLFIYFVFLAIWLTLPHSAQLNRISVIFWSAYSFFIAFMTKLSSHMSALPSDPRHLHQVNMPDGGEKWWVKEQPSRVKKSPNPSSSKLKSNNFTKCWGAF